MSEKDAFLRMGGAHYMPLPFDNFMNRIKILYVYGLKDHHESTQPDKNRNSIVSVFLL